MLRAARFTLSPLLMLAALSVPPPALAARLPAFEPGETVTIGAVVDGGELVLADGRRVRLVGIEAPHPAAAHSRAWPYAEEAKAALEKLVLGRAVDNRRGVAEMLAREDRARQARRGIWRDRFYAVRAADDAGRYAGSFQIVEGTAVDTAMVEGQLFINFGGDWRTAFSLRLPPDALRLFRAEGVDAAALKGARLRVRGWVRGSERPIIDVTHPEQIERL